MSQPTASTERDARRKAVRRTAWAIALAAVAVYAGFMASMVLK